MIESGETTVEFVELDEHRTKVVVTSRMICAEELIEMSKPAGAASSTSSRGYSPPSGRGSATKDSPPRSSFAPPANCERSRRKSDDNEDDENATSR